jgi:lipopolysaccharide biosynthesis glycosyltransferase
MQNAIVTAVDSKYLPAACCTLLSCAGDGETEAQTKFFLLACDVSTGDVEKAHRFLKSRDASVEIFVIGADRFQPFRVDGYVSAATYSRLLLPEFFDDRWDRLLYVDADTRIMVRLQTLLDTSLHGRPVGAVHDYLRYLIYGMGDSRKRLALRSEAPYFNAGVICFNWRATIASGLLRRAKSFAVENAHLCVSHDQDALNKAFEGAWTPLDPRWNFMTVAVPDDVLRLDYPARFRPYIAHFAGSVKPWMANFPVRHEHHRAWYRDLLRDSPWPHFAAPANAPLGETPATSYADRLALTEATTAQEPRNASTRKSPPTGVLEVGDGNPELEHLLEVMVAESAGSDDMRIALRRLLDRGSPLSTNPAFLMEFIRRVMPAFLLEFIRQFRARNAGVFQRFFRRLTHTN